MNLHHVVRIDYLDILIIAIVAIIVGVLLQLVHVDSWGKQRSE